ncbi:MAG: GNAT family N-acetyltransferase, partial [Trueperella pyogenes]|nr:GNAT family N-acetyltransferase [Trueperella pyogenes]
LKARGFHWERTYYDLRAKLDPLPQAPSLGSYMTIEQWSPSWDDELRRAANLIAQQQGRAALTEEQWTMGRSSFAPDWSYIAVDRRSDRPRIAGFTLVSKYEQDWPALGWKEGYIDHIGVGDEWRNTPVLDALVVASMRAQAQDGMDLIATGIAQTEGSATLSVFEYLGFRVVGQQRLYAIDIPDIS